MPAVDLYDSLFYRAADFQLAASVLLAAALAIGSLANQPARRLVIAWTTIAAIGLLVALSLTPGWSIWRIGASSPPQQPPSVAAVATTPATTPETSPIRVETKTPPTLAQPSTFVSTPEAIQAPTVASVNWVERLKKLSVLALLVGSAIATGWLLIGAILARRLINRADPSELRIVLAHELAHLRNRDLWLLAGLRLLLLALWCNPLYWLMRRRVRLDQETLADAAAADLTDRHTYAEQLLGWARDRQPQPRLAGAAGIWESPSQLRRRIALLLDDGFTVVRQSSLRWRAACGVACLSLAIVASLVTLGPAEPATLEPTTPGGGDAPVRETSANAKPGTKPAGASADARSAPATREKAVVSGLIVGEDGSPIKNQGRLDYVSYEMVNGKRTSGIHGLAGQYRDRFRCSVRAGTIWLTYFAKGYAPAWTEEFELAPGQKREDVNLVLKRGYSANLLLSDEEGNPISNATVVAHPEIHGQLGGPDHEQVTDEKGKLALTHLADTRYGLRIEAPGFEPLRTEALLIDKGSTLTLSLVRSEPTTGTIMNADGTPAAQAKIRGRYGWHPDGKAQRYSSGGDGFWGEVLTEADEKGRFRLDQLTAGFKYLMVIEGPDGARAIVDDLKAGQIGKQIVLPSRRDLVVKVRGDLDKLQLGRANPYITVRQRVNVRYADGTTYGDLIGDDATVEPIEGGGRAVLKGLAIDMRSEAPEQQVQVMVGSDSATQKTVPLNESGDTVVEFVLPPDDKGDSAKEAPANAKPGIAPSGVSADARSAPAPTSEKPIALVGVQDTRSNVGNPAIDTVNDAIRAYSQLIGEKKPYRAVKMLTKVLQRYPGDERLLSARARAYSEAKRYSESIADYEAAGKRDKSNWFNAKVDLAYLYVHADDDDVRDADRAILLLEEVMQAGYYNDNWVFLSGLSEAYLAANDLQSAVVAQRRAVNWAPEWAYEKNSNKLIELQEKLGATGMAKPTVKTIRLRVCEEDGAPIEGAWVGFHDENPIYDHGSQSLDSEVRTGIDGWCILPINKERHGYVWVRAKGFEIRPPDCENPHDVSRLDGQTLVLGRTNGVVFEVGYQGKDRLHSYRAMVERVGEAESGRPWVPRDWTGIFLGGHVGRGFVSGRINGVNPNHIWRVLLDTSVSGRVILSDGYFSGVQGKFYAKSLKNRGYEKVNSSTYRVALHEAGSVRGRVVSDSPDAPLDRSFSLQTRHDRSRVLYGTAEVQPDARGRFEVAKLMDGWLEADFRPKANDPWRASIGSDLSVRADTTTELLVTLERGVLVRGTIPPATFDGSQGPSQPIPVTFEWGDTLKNAGSPFCTLTTSTDDDGKYSAYVPRGDVKIRTAVGPYKDYQPQFVECKFTLATNSNEYRVPTPDPAILARGKVSNGWVRQGDKDDSAKEAPANGVTDSQPAGDSAKSQFAPSTSEE